MKSNNESSQMGAMPLIGKSTHGIKQFDSSVDLLSPPHFLGNVYIHNYVQNFVINANTYRALRMINECTTHMCWLMTMVP